MKQITLSVLILLLVISSFAQTISPLNLTPDKIILKEQNFYILKVVDNRPDKKSAGYIVNGINKLQYPLNFNVKLEDAVFTYLNSSMDNNKDYTPIVMVLNKFEVIEEKIKGEKYGFFNIAIDFYYLDLKLGTQSEKMTIVGGNISKYREMQMKQGLKECLTKFAKSDWVDTLNHFKSNPVLNYKKDDSGITYPNEEPVTERINTINSSEKNYQGTRNAFASGYQIGGLNFVGFDYELRLSNLVGIHAGVGFKGYTFGAKIHTNSKKNSPYLNVSYKDGGFGLLKIGALEYGMKWIFYKSTDQGMVFQLGLGKVLYIDDRLAYQLYKNKATPQITLTFGVGFCW